MRRLRQLPRFVASVALGACSGGMPSGNDGGMDSGCTPSDFPADASTAEYDNVCYCHESSF